MAGPARTTALSPQDALSVLLVGFTVPDSVIREICRVDKYMPIQTHKLSWSILRGLELSGCNVSAVSSLPIQPFPQHPLMFIRGELWKRGGDRTIQSTSFVNLVAIRHITRFLSILRLIGTWAWQIRNDRRKVMLVYSIHSAHLCAALCVGASLRIPTVIVITDPPTSHLPGEGLLTRWLRWIDRAVIDRFVRRTRGIVGVADELRSFAPGLPFLRMEGIANTDDFPQVTGERSGGDGTEHPEKPVVFVYAGALEPEYGVSLLLDAFSHLSRVDCRLWIAGKGTFEGAVRAAAVKNERIIYLGYLASNDLRLHLAKAHFLVNARPAYASFAQQTFPSKILQYLATGKPVISTRLPGIPPEYWNHLIPIDDERPEAVAELFSVLATAPYEPFRRRGLVGLEFVLRDKSEPAQGMRLAAFLRSVTA